MKKIISNTITLICAVFTLVMLGLSNIQTFVLNQFVADITGFGAFDLKDAFINSMLIILAIIASLLIIVTLIKFLLDFKIIKNSKLAKYIDFAYVILGIALLVFAILYVVAIAVFCNKNWVADIGTGSKPTVAAICILFALGIISMIATLFGINKLKKSKKK